MSLRVTEGVEAVRYTPLQPLLELVVKDITVAKLMPVEEAMEQVEAVEQEVLVEMVPLRMGEPVEPDLLLTFLLVEALP